MHVGIVGLGSIGKRHLSNLVSLGYKNLSVVSERKKIKHYQIEDATICFFDEYDDFLQSTADCVIICNPTSLHEEYLRRALGANKHVLLEKPASTSSAGLAKIAVYADDLDKVVGMVHQFRFDEGIQRLRRYVDKGEIGEILQVNAVQGEHIADFHPGEDYRRSYAARSELGGGVLLTQIHQVDLLNWLFGPFESVYAIGGNSERLSINVEDHSSYLLKNNNGVPVYGHVDYLLRPRTMRISVTGTKGIVEWNYYAARLTFKGETSHDKKIISSWVFDRDVMFRKVLQNFFDSITARTRPRSDLSDGINAIKVVEGIKRSMASGEVERINSCRT